MQGFTHFLDAFAWVAVMIIGGIGVHETWTNRDGKGAIVAVAIWLTVVLRVVLALVARS